MGAQGGRGLCGEARREGGRGVTNRSDAPQTTNPTPDSQWPLWEVFMQPSDGAPHEHAGSLHAVDAEHALQNARDVYARRGEGISIWVVPTNAITSSTPEDMGPFFDPGNDKPYRHPQFYKVPRGVKM